MPDAVGIRKSSGLQQHALGGETNLMVCVPRLRMRRRTPGKNSSDTNTSESADAAPKETAAAIWT